MRSYSTKTSRLVLSVLFLFLVSCSKPPYNNFEPTSNARKYGVGGAGIGSAFGALAGATGVGAAAGGAFGVARGHYLDSKKGLINSLRREDVQIIEEDNQLTLLVPTDKYYHLNQAKLRETRYQTLNQIVKLLKHYPRGDIYVAGFTDDVGSIKHKKDYSQHLAQEMTTFLWANGFPQSHLHPEGYADKHTIADNQLIHGSAMNRRVEIQWRGNDTVVLVRKGLHPNA